MNPFLVDAAEKHSQWIFNSNGETLDHFEGAAGPSERMVAAGYKFTNGFGWGENIAKNFAGDQGQSGFDAIEQLLFTDIGIDDRGHRRGLLATGVNEIGVGAFIAPNNHLFVTEDFANAGNGNFVTGTLINDTNANGTYDIGEGLGGVTITATRASDNQTFTTTSWASGGYSLLLAPGTYSVAATGGAIGTPVAQMVTISNQNVEADFISTAAATPAAPTIVTQPISPLGNVNSSVTLNVAADGSPFPTVQWQVSTDAGTTFNDVPGATGFAYTFTATAGNATNSYRAIVSNSQGSVTSNSVQARVFGIPVVITKELDAIFAKVGDTVTYTVGATGATSYQWYTGASWDTLAPIAGATGHLLHLHRRCLAGRQFLPGEGFQRDGQRVFHAGD